MKLKADSANTLWHRRVEYEPQYGFQVNTRLSYCRISDSLCKTTIAFLFLVDSPVEIEVQDMMIRHLTLRVPCSDNRGGLSIPQLYEQGSFAMFESMQSFLSHSRHFELFTRTDESVDPVVLAYFLSASLWRTNLRHLDWKIKNIVFTDLRRPSVKINDRLHDCRQELDMLVGETQLAAAWVSQKAQIEFGELRLSYDWEFPPETFHKTLEDAKALESFLMDTFQLLMSTISVLDSQASILEAKRGARLTQLATIYVPLSFVTGIFGMNIQQINNSGPSAWVAVVTLVIVSMLTAAALWIMTELIDPLAATGSRRSQTYRVPAKKSKVDD